MENNLPVAIQMVDLKSQYDRVQCEIDEAILSTIRDTSFINGPPVSQFAQKLSRYLGDVCVIPCANGTDALQIAMMALDLEPGDEVIVPSFTYIATAEVICLLRLVPVMVDVDPYHFNLTRENIEKAITSRTRAIVPVHLFGQCADMESILSLANEHNLYVIEDAAQSIGAVYTFTDGSQMQAGTMGHVGCTSFFPSKNLGCYGDGGALFTRDLGLAEKIKMITNHGQVRKYVHKYIGVNSRLDTIQAAILNVKIKYLNEYIKARNEAADRYDALLAGIDELILPKRTTNSTHVFHQYTLQVKDGKRDNLKIYLEAANIPAMIYYPLPLNEQEAFAKVGIVKSSLKITKELCASVLSLPMHTELSSEQQEYIAAQIKSYFKL